MKFDGVVAGAVLITAGGLIINSLSTPISRPIIIPYVKLPSRPDRFVGDPEVEVEIAGKRTHMRCDSGYTKWSQTYQAIQRELSFILYC